MNVKKYLASSIVCLVTLFHGNQAVQAQLNNGFFIYSSLSGRCIDAGGAPGTGNGTRLQLYDCELSGFNRDNGSATDHRWEIIAGGFIRNTLSGKCIDVAGAPGTGNNAPVQLYDCELSGFNRDNGSPTDQRWEIIGGGFIRNTLSGRCIDVGGAPGTGNGTQLQLYDCELSGFNRDNGSLTDQTWRLSF